MLILFLTTGVFLIWITPVVSNGRLLYVLLCYNNASNCSVMEMLVISVKRRITLQEETLIHVADGAVSFPASE